MKSNISRDFQGNLTIHMEGDVGYEYGEPLKKEIASLLKRNPFTTLTLDIAKLNFVGSTGICHFVDTLKILNARTKRVTLTQVSEEFHRLFKLYNLDNDLYECDFGMSDDNTDDLNQRFGNRESTFEN